MEYIGVEIFDGLIDQVFLLDNEKPIKEQWMYLHDDIGGVNYKFREYEFFVDISWMGDWNEIEKGFFRVRIFEGSSKTNGKTFFCEETKTTDLTQLKEIFQNAINKIISIKSMSEEVIYNHIDVQWYS